MKTLQEYITESSKVAILKKLQKNWDDYNSELPIDMQELIGFAKQALKSAGTKPKYILDELSRYDDPDDLDRALDDGVLGETLEFLDELANVMADSDYKGAEGDYADNVGNPSFLWDFISYINQYEK